MIKVLLQYTVRDWKATLHLFEKTVELPLSPYPGLVLRGPNMLLPAQGPDLIAPHENVIARITVCEDQTVICHLFSGIEGAMTGPELEAAYAKKGWEYHGPCRPDTPEQEDDDEDEALDPLAN